MARTPSNNPAAVRARERRAKEKRERQEQSAAPGAEPLFDPDAEPSDDKAPSDRGPGRPIASYRRPGLQEITRNLLALPNGVLARFFPHDALTRTETQLLARGLVNDPLTGPYIARMAQVGVHSDLLEAVTMIVMSRLITHGIIPFGREQFEQMMADQGQGNEGQSEYDNEDARRAEPAAAGADPWEGVFGGPAAPSGWQPPEPAVPVAAG